MRAKILVHAAMATLMALSAASAVAQPIGDPAAGGKLVAAWCTECHTVSGAATGSPAGTPGRAPDLVEVAKRPRTTALLLNVFLRSNHDNMPNIMLTRDQADDIVAYILSLKER